ncbi:hypothetical protein [Bacillus sp. V5-8f]|uniref:hypothetical protein n=1 Tax=Bacillus sp. V5-8f TaxID=2053044 RepID=UPI000C77055C|nr:hypothetical protein [Bacillus sp. V5-8f]PLT35091.1 hypothetical protein CUU64_06835 [Bacillus sp. V5-8f]
MEKNKKPDEFYDTLRKMGLKVEKEINKKIKDLLNNRRIINQASMESNNIAQAFKWLQDSMETISALGNFPTKRDIANVAKMQVQLEGKIDHIEDMLSNLENDHRPKGIHSIQAESAEKDRKARKRARLRAVLRSMNQGVGS